MDAVEASRRVHGGARASAETHLHDLFGVLHNGREERQNVQVPSEQLGRLD